MWVNQILKLDIFHALEFNTNEKEFNELPFIKYFSIIYILHVIYLVSI